MGSDPFRKYNGYGGEGGDDSGYDICKEDPFQSGSEHPYYQDSHYRPRTSVYSGLCDHGPEQEPSVSNSEPDKTTAETERTNTGLKQEEVEMLEKEHASSPIVTQDSVDRSLIAQFMDSESQADTSDPLLQELLASMNQHKVNGETKVNGEKH